MSSLRPGSRHDTAPGRRRRLGRSRARARTRRGSWRRPQGPVGSRECLNRHLDTVDTVDRSQRSRYVNRSMHCKKHKMFVVSWRTSKWSTPLSQILSYLLAEKHPTSPEHLKHLSALFQNSNKITFFMLHGKVSKHEPAFPVSIDLPARPLLLLAWAAYPTRRTGQSVTVRAARTGLKTTSDESRMTAANQNTTRGRGKTTRQPSRGPEAEA